MTAIKRSTLRPRVRRIALVSTVAAAGLVLAACGNDDDMSGMDHGSKSENSASASATTGENPAPGTFNDADVKFAQMMIPHHEQAVEMSKLADEQAEDAKIKTLAGDIEKAQDPEIKKMKSWLKAWGKPESGSGMPGMDHGSDSSMPGMDHGSGSSDNSGMPGMMSDKDMKELKAAKGADFDKMFAQMMIGHHNGAIDMAKDEQKNGKNATAKKLADDVVKTQTAEVKQLRGMLDKL
ncbi:hypothetical protein Z951_39805 [Streptomyces sp. PRh5]|uniref:DUF305 domain-containing protein n=1 Tax=Streptomyces sp. PRh5 TaxID=1158056 RepID=UPI000453773B|nr:DUF305 domain-containing protein [Streptomyces sp. PRh5]EXU62728.1 hypothetical protein Z951_39805 [Streptomyces sp. PRh5]